MKKLGIILFLFLPLVKIKSQVPYELWGITCYGGDNFPNGNGPGVIFKTNPLITNHTVQYNFGENPGAQPGRSALCEAANGKLYGVTNIGGAYNNNFGVLFEYDTLTFAYTKKVTFGGAAFGENPAGSLIKANNNKLYGLTVNGGSFFKGILFEYDPTTGIFTKKIDFDGVNIGQFPSGSLIQHTNGKFMVLR